MGSWPRAFCKALCQWPELPKISMAGPFCWCDSMRGIPGSLWAWCVPQAALLELRPVLGTVTTLETQVLELLTAFGWLHTKGSKICVGTIQTQCSAQTAEPPGPRHQRGWDLDYFKEGSPKCGAWLRVPFLSSKGHTDHGIANMSMMSCKHSGPRGNQHIVVNLRSRLIGKWTILSIYWKYRMKAVSILVPSKTSSRPKTPVIILSLTEQLFCPRPFRHSISYPL